jgi:hypothetical protein
MERHYPDGTEPDVLPHWSCHGPCQQGRLRCPTPEACELPPEQDMVRVVLGDLVVSILLLLAVAAAALVLVELIL